MKIQRVSSISSMSVHKLRGIGAEEVRVDLKPKFKWKWKAEQGFGGQSLRLPRSLCQGYL